MLRASNMHLDMLRIAERKTAQSITVLLESFASAAADAAAAVTSTQTFAYIMDELACVYIQMPEHNNKFAFHRRHDQKSA